MLVPMSTRPLYPGPIFLWFCALPCPWLGTPPPLSPPPPRPLRMGRSPSDHSADTFFAALELFEDPDLGGAVPLGDPLLLPAAPASGVPAPRPGYGEACEELPRYPRPQRASRLCERPGQGHRPVPAWERVTSRGL